MPYIGQKPHDKVVTASEISDGIITADKLASNAVTTAKINADAVTDAKIADDVVGTEHLTAGEVDTTALGADAVTAAKIADNAISEEHLDATIVTGLTALAAEPADTDEFLISDAGTLKRIDYSYIKGSTLSTLDIDGATDIGADIADADLFIVDDGAGGTNRKAAASRLIDYVGVAYKSVGTWENLTSGAQVSYDGIANSSGIILIKNNTRGHKTPIPFYGRGGGGIGFYFVFLDPDDQNWTSSTSFSFQETGADVNTYTVAHTTGGGVVTVERTSGSQSYDVQIYKIDWGHSI
tara:strand:- start:365 stop:1249 length:885 start_codon:yes stop_codon:yes gene_type:complete